MLSEGLTVVEPPSLVRASVALSPRAVARVEVEIAAGTWRLEVEADAPVRVAAETSAGVIRLRGEPGAVRFATAEPLTAFQVWPTDTACRSATLRLTPDVAWAGLTPDWSLGPIRQPPRLADAAPGRPTTPQGWQDRIRIDAAEAVEVDGDQFDVGEAGTVRLSLYPPLPPGSYVLEGYFIDDRGAPAWVEPQVLHTTATSPRARIAAMRRRHDATYAAELALPGETTQLLLRPREQRGLVRIPWLQVRPLSTVARAWTGVRRATSALAFAGTGSRRAELPAPRPLRRTGPRVSIVTATRDAPLHLVRYLNTIRTTDYRPYELVLVDNGTTNTDALHLLNEAKSRGITVIRDERPFNFAALNNLAVTAASGDLLVFANNDLEFLHPSWLGALVEAVADPRVGFAGSRLLYPDGRVQHAGLVLAGESRVRHAERFLSGKSAGYRDRQRRRTEVVAVTGALMAVRRELFDQLGGFDAQRYAVLYNDVDLCLKANEAGYCNVLEPASLAVHHESATIGQQRLRGLFARGGEIWQYERAVEGDRFRQDWAHVLDADPYYPSEFDPLDARFRRRV